MTSSEKKFKEALKKYLPEKSIDYCHWLWHENDFSLRIKKRRASKLGDYRFDPATGRQSISVNNNLNPYSFLITYIHEVAHLVTYSIHKRTVKPHGAEWKKNFRKLMTPMLTTEIFPQSVLQPLKEYLKNPKASSCNDHTLMAALRLHDAHGSLQLSDIPTGELFKFKNRVFRKESLRRSRYVCCEVSSNLKYLISKMAEVEKV
ncbi:SprT-like domain-containing protein [Fulvivirga maritima]|uniref:SprT-like domain-containing protein n=1 Tax=Fulvivirga maritima TaxID=2904247 RepID=UPI001F332651|nr:SprT-like domain-containing protein [Fulvivirga maritima]UII27815.1 SprT-like domain-containing protein [Fulvivirga maritima]